MGFVLFIIITSALFVINRSTIRNKLKLSENVTVVALGDSHAACSVDDRDKTWLRNLGASAESLAVSRVKLNHLLHENPQIKTVLLFFSFHSLTKRVEQEWHGDSVKYDNILRVIGRDRINGGITIHPPRVYFKQNGTIIDKPTLCRFLTTMSSCQWIHHSYHPRLLQLQHAVIVCSAGVHKDLRNTYRHVKC